MGFPSPSNPLLNVLPRFAVNNVPDMSLTNTIVGSQFSVQDVASGVARTDFENLSNSQFCPACALSASRAISPASIPHVIGNCSEREMRWINTGRIIAGVTDMHILRDCSIREEVGKPMGIPCMAIAATYSDYSVPVSLSCGSPQPTSIRLLDFLPEACRCGITVGFLRDILGTHGNLLSCCAKPEDARNVAPALSRLHYSTGGLCTQ